MLQVWSLIVVLALAPVPATAAAAVPDAAQVMAVPGELREVVRQRVVAPGGSRSQRLERLADYVFGDDGLALEYDNSTTRTVAEVYRDRKANCLSFTLLFVALAREAGLEAQVQEVGEVLAWYQDEGVIYNANHVNVGVRVGTQWQVVDVDTNILAARNRPRGIDDRRAMAHFHNNRGAELLVEGDSGGARAALLAALEDDPDFVAAWNNLGVLLLREGDVRGAEHAYFSALRRNHQHAATLSNLVGLYRRNGDVRMQRRYEWRLDSVQNSDPFHQFMRALECENNGDYDCAVARYRRAIRLQDGEHTFHFGLARVYFLSGDLPRAQRELGRAYTLGGSEQVRSVYRQKLENLRRWRQQASSHLGH
ncbi:transglutaminase-like domain-containing protein [Pseudoxanthomonas suwonensis]|uniref:Transglutaminase n=1 Tax=Pseudoxanthomonas suwonensis TaxID=314722 RepID=A0A0E3Z4N7_9GAMM|nr:transglutaminase-like domain-containing protein [Pseudoxanthomonas suwonensis]AKC88034.1 transglutaminase [Pseudoxanthomonas suwonensis]